MHETVDATLPPDDRRRHPAIGIIGGGQLARMTAMAALQMGCDTVVLERTASGPAATLATHLVVGDWNDAETLASLASRVDVVTLENEFIDAGRLAVLERAGTLVLPTSATIALVQDKLRQKETLAAAGLAVAPFHGVDSADDVRRLGATLGWPLLLKARLGAYDGKGNVTLRSPGEVDEAWSALGGDKGRLLYVEGFCHFSRELAIIITRGRDGSVAVYPLVETEQEDHICRIVRAPAPVDPLVGDAARDLAVRAVEAVGAVGSFGVELFLMTDGRLAINELAPRVHNSGHFSIEACACSQFENHVRAVLGWPLGSTAMRTPAAVMVNLLGRGEGPGWPGGMQEAVAVPGASVHIYGKAASRRGRKMGHVTACDQSIVAAEATAMRAAAALGFGDAQ